MDFSTTDPTNINIRALTSEITEITELNLDDVRGLPAVQAAAGFSSLILRGRVILHASNMLPIGRLYVILQ